MAIFLTSFINLEMEKNTKNRTINVIPDSIFFRDVAPGDSDSTEIWIHNVGKKPVSIRIKMPTDSPFSVSTSSLPMTAPGIETKIIISYTARSDTPIHSKLLVCSDDCNISVPITAIPPCPRIITEKKQIDLGTIGMNSDFKFTFLLSNMGTAEGKYKLSGTEESLTFMPAEGLIQPSKTAEIVCNIHPEEEGNFSFSINPDVEGAFEPCDSIEVSYKSIPQSLALMINDKEVKELDFETIYFGQKRVITATLLNRGPFKQSFVFSSQKIINEASSKEKLSQLNSNTSDDNIFTAVPSEGLINPYGSSIVRFIFNPPIDKTQEEDTDSLFNQYMTIDIVETLQKIEFRMVGKAVRHLISLSSIDFNFEKIPIKQKSTQKLIIKNHSHFLPTNFEIKPIAQFRFEPCKGTLKIDQSFDVNVIFYPKNLGSFEISTLITFCGGLSKKRINLYGLCDNDDKPFKRVPIYETDQETRFKAMHPDTRFAYDLNEIKKNEEKRHQNDLYLIESEEKRAEILKKRELNSRMKKDAESYLSRTVGQYTQEDVKEFIQSKMSDEEYMKKYTIDNNSTNSSDNDNRSYRKAKVADNGLVPPDPPLRMKKEPLYIPNPSKFGLISSSSDEKTAIQTSQKKEFQDENILIKKKFKSKATTPVEINECTRGLTPAQQLMVTSSHQTLNFGEISVFSNIAKSFSIQNNLQQNILVTMKYEYEELSESTPMSQIIPPGQIGGFDIKFTSKKPQNFMKQIQYVINGHHTYSFNVCAHVVPIDVQLSRSSIDFRFTSDSTLPIIKEYVTLSNKSNSTAEFNWCDVLPPFYIENQKGYIEAGKSIGIEIVYRPGTKSLDEQTLTCEIVGGISRTLKVVGEVGNPRCTLPKKTVNFGLIPIGLEQTSMFKVKNSGDDDAMFTVIVPRSSPELHVTPKNGKICAKDSIQLQVSYKAISAHVFDVPVSIAICGSSQLTFNVTGQSEIPDVQVTNTEFDFGRIYVGSSASIDSQITNASKIPAVLILDFSNHPDFRIEFAPSLADEFADEGPEGSDKKNSISLVSDTTFVTRMERNQGEYLANSSLSIVSATKKGGDIDDFDDFGGEDNGEVKVKNEREKGLIYELNLAEESSIDFTLVFQPTEVADHSFELPMSLLNVVAPSSFKLQPIVSGEAIESPILMSATALDFGVKPIHDPLNPNCPPSSLLLKLKSETREAVEWRIELKGNKDDSFVINPNEGVLYPSKSEFVKIQFTPKSAIPFNSFLSLFVISKDTEKEDNLIGKVQLTGIGSSEMFKPSFHEVCMPIVPINTKSQMDISIINVAKIQSTLKIQVPVDENSFPVKFSFPKGNQLLHTTQELPLSISFCASRPMSFTTVAAIVDDLGNASSFVLTCTCDNSVFTIYPYLSNKHKGTKKETFSKDFLESAELQSRFLTASDIIELKDKKWNATVSQVMISFFHRYLNVLVLSTQMNDFPGDLINSNGSLVTEAITNLTGGKKIQGANSNSNETFSDTRKKNLNETAKSKDSSESSSGQNTNVTTRRNAFKQLLHTLQSLGALLSSVRPEFLMKKSDFMSLMKAKVTKQILGVDYFGAPDVSSFDQSVLSEVKSSKAFSSALLTRLDVLETVYDSLSIECWMTVILQVIKLFVMARIDTEKMGHTAGYQDALKQAKAILQKQPNGNELFNEINKSSKQLQSFSTASVQELSLLKWISLHYIKSGGDIKRKFTDFTSLYDSIGFSYLVRSHSTLYRAALNENATTNDQIESNAIEFINGLKNLQLSFVPKPAEIVDNSQCVLATITEYFYETLPHYLPSTSLEFNTTLHKTVTKSISLTNPSKNEIVYFATLEGDRNFVLKQDLATVGPGQTVEFMISFLARTIRKVTGRVILIPSKPRIVTQRSGMLPTEKRESALSTSRNSSSAKGLPLYSVPVVVDIASAVSIEGPDESFNIETNVYTPKKLSIPVKNILEINGLRIKIFIKVDKILDENGKQINKSNTITAAIEHFIENPAEQCQKTQVSESNELNDLIASHNTFIINTNEIILDNDNTSIDLEFIPIELGTYRCLILFQNEVEGEFIYEVVAKSILPTPVDFGGSKIKTEAGKEFNISLPVDLENQGLLRALSYSQMKNSNISEWKFKDMVNKKIHEFEASFRKSFESQKFTVIASSQYFEIPNELTLLKPAATTTTNTSETKKDNQNVLNFTFKPIKAGEYPCKVVLLSLNDIRVYQIRGIGLPATRELHLEFSTVFGRTIHQDIPVVNPSNDPWQLKVNISGDSSFSSPTHLTAKPKSQLSIPVTFTPYKIGTFSADMTVHNFAKESTTIYKLTATVDEPPAEDKIIVDCKARRDTTRSFMVKPFIKNGTCEVTATVPMIQFQKEITFKDAQESEFSFSLYAPRGGISAGTITFTDPETKNFIWYIVEIHVDSPSPEGSIEVTTTARKSVNIPIPIENNNSYSVKYSVSFSDDDLHGLTEFIAPPNYKSNYPLIVTPLKAGNKTVSIHFYSDNGGEFWYKLNITVEPPQCQILAPLSAPIGKTASAFVLIENQSSKPSSITVENDNAAAFQAITKNFFQLAPNEGKKIEIRYTPTAVGLKETAKISFKSDENGDYEFSLSGNGKPPQPLSPTIVTASVDTPNSALILFTNPFSYPSIFSVSMTSDREDVFQFLIKKKIFTLNTYGEECQIPFTFSPDAIGQYKGHIVVSSLGPSRGPLPELESLPSIRWVYPIIGNSTESGTVENHQIKSKAQQTVNQNMTFTLVGEYDSFNASEYKISMSVPSSLEFIRSILELKPEKIEKTDNMVNLTVKVNFSPQRPFNQTISISISNPIGQEWKFPLELSVDLGKPCDTIMIESLLSKTGTTKIQIPSHFREKTPFHAYFAAGSASEFSLTDSHGIIEPSSLDSNELPVEVVFAPKMYGKILKGLLVIDTLDSQFLFDVVGKTPDYVPPVAKKSSIEGISPKRGDEDMKRLDITKKKKRNIIKDNIDGVRITKPKLDQK